MNASMNGDQLFAMEIIKWLVILCVALSIPTTIIGVVAFWRTQTGAAKTFSMLIERGSIVRLAAIFAIIFSTFKLCVANLLKPEIRASIFSGIAGYVLEGAPRARAVSPDDEN